MPKEIPVSFVEIINEFLDTVEFKAKWVLMNSANKESLYNEWSSALNTIMTIPAYTERAQQLSQYLDTLFHGDPFAD